MTSPKVLASAPGLGAQTYIRCYQYGQSLNHIQKHFILLALRKRGHLGSWRLNSLYSKVDRAVDTRARVGDTRSEKGLDYANLREVGRYAGILGSGIP